MLQTMLLMIVAVPLALGATIAMVSSVFPKAKNSILALLIPVSAAAVFVGLEGFPAFPPVRAIHKLPYVFVIGGIVLAILAWIFTKKSKLLAIIGAFAGLSLPVWWMGNTILANNNQKLTVTLALVVIAVGGVILTVSKHRVAGEVESPVLLQAAFATSLAGALVAILGGYMGMAMFNGGLTALFGGYLLVTYISYLRGNRSAFELNGVGQLAFAWVAHLGVLATAILAPIASSAALIATALTLSFVPMSSFYTSRFTSVAVSVRPLVYGLFAAIPAVAGIIIAGLQFSG